MGLERQTCSQLGTDGSTQEAKKCESLSSRPVQSTEIQRAPAQSGQHRETLSRKTNQPNKQAKTERLGLELTYKVILALCLQTTAREFQKED